MTSKASSVPAGVERLTKLLAHLNKQPRLTLSGVKTLRVSYAFRNDHFGARYFAKEALPRIRYANPDTDILISRPHKGSGEHWRPEIQLQFENGTSHTIDMHQKWSSTILKELMGTAGGPAWAAHVRAQEAAGLPVVEGEAEDAAREREARLTEGETVNPPNWDEYRAAHPEAGKSQSLSSKGSGSGKKKEKNKEAKKVDGEKNAKAGKNVKKDEPKTPEQPAPTPIAA